MTMMMRKILPEVLLGQRYGKVQGAVGHLVVILCRDYMDCNPLA